MGQQATGADKTDSKQLVMMRKEDVLRLLDLCSALENAYEAHRDAVLDVRMIRIRIENAIGNERPTPLAPAPEQVQGCTIGSTYSHKSGVRRNNKGG
jgi:hypothetical protein